MISEVPSSPAVLFCNSMKSASLMKDNVTLNQAKGICCYKKYEKPLLISSVKDTMTGLELSFYQNNKKQSGTDSELK